jgi:hypothetical protein
MTAVEASGHERTGKLPASVRTKKEAQNRYHRGSSRETFHRKRSLWRD